MTLCFWHQLLVLLDLVVLVFGILRVLLPVLENIWIGFSSKMTLFVKLFTGNFSSKMTLFKKWKSCPYTISKEGVTDGVHHTNTERTINKARLCRQPTPFLYHDNNEHVSSCVVSSRSRLAILFFFRLFSSHAEHRSKFQPCRPPMLKMLRETVSCSTSQSFSNTHWGSWNGPLMGDSWLQLEKTAWLFVICTPWRSYSCTHV